MLRYIFKRLLMIIPVMLLATFIVFTINYFSPADPATVIAGETATQEQIDQIREDLGLNDPFFVQFFRYIGKVLRLDLGTSWRTGRPVAEEVLERAPTTILLTIVSMGLATFVGVLLGIISAVNQYSYIDSLATFFSLLGASMPQFWLGLMLMLFFSLRLGWLPASGFDTPKQWILPAITVSVTALANITRITRSSMLEIIRQDYIRTARAKGLNQAVVILYHGLRNALIPVITVVGMLIGRTLGGAIVTEGIYSIPGLGSYIINAIRSKNNPAIQGSILFCALLFCLVNLIVDIIYAYADPRIKAKYLSGRKQPARKPAVEASTGKAG
jgi:peptide/nickel transport system permease protein